MLLSYRLQLFHSLLFLGRFGIIHVEELLCLPLILLLFVRIDFSLRLLLPDLLKIQPIIRLERQLPAPIIFRWWVMAGTATPADVGKGVIVDCKRVPAEGST